MKLSMVVRIGAFFILSVFWAVLLVYLAVLAGYFQIVRPMPGWLQHPFDFAYMHLQSSIWWFSCLLVMYFALIVRMRRLLDDQTTSLARLIYNDRLINVVVSLFFGVGVIYTAVGMENALVNALGVLGGQSSELRQVGALDIMNRLVNGGLLIALSTTIFGGSIGYALRFLKIFLIGSRWDERIMEES